MRAVGYIRWSSGKQSAGSTEERQRDVVEKFCRDEAWLLDSWVADDGVSAWTGANIREGGLSAFIDRMEVEGGHGLVLVVETQDRLSRIKEIDFLEWFLRVLRTGLTVAFVDNGMIVDQVSFRNQRRQIIGILEAQSEANAYVEKLSKRVRAAYDRMRASGQIVHSSATVPSWLEVIYGDWKQGKRPRLGFRPIPARVAVVERIYGEYSSGLGLHTIARRLNEESIATFRGGKGWRASSVKSIVTDRATIGEYQHKSRAQGLKAIGDPVPNYFPAVISNELWQRANNPDLLRVQSAKTQGDKFRCLISDFARCHSCDGRMTLIDRQRCKGERPVCYLVCDNYKRGLGCDQVRRTAYAPLETVLLDALLNLALDDVHFQDGDSISAVSAQLANERRRLEDVSRSLDNIADALKTLAGDERLLHRYATLKAEEEAAKGVIAATEKALRIAKGSVTPAEHVLRVSAMRKELNHFDEDRRLRARRVVKFALNNLIMRVEIKAGSQQVKYQFHTHRRYPEGVPAALPYVPTERQEAVIVLRKGMRYIHVDLNRGVLFDVANSTGRGTDEVIDAYHRRAGAL
jgi:DNA invertase Pin-like site-specific DNA recombinase